MQAATQNAVATQALTGIGNYVCLMSTVCMTLMLVSLRTWISETGLRCHLPV